MSEETKKGWHKGFFTAEELKEFEDLGKELGRAKIKAYEEKWAALIDEVKQNINEDPTSEKAQDLARRWHSLFDEGYGGHPKLKARIGEAYRSGQMPAQYQTFGPEVWDFIAKATKVLKKKSTR